MRKPTFCICENKDADQLRGSVTAKLISDFVFATKIVQSLYFLNPKFQTSNHHLWLYSPVCVRPGRKPRRPVFSERGSNFQTPTNFTVNTLSHTKWFYLGVISPNCSNRTALRSNLIWVCTVYPGISVRELWIITESSNQIVHKTMLKYFIQLFKELFYTIFFLNVLKGNSISIVALFVQMFRENMGIMGKSYIFFIIYSSFHSISSGHFPLEVVLLGQSLTGQKVQTLSI